MFRSICAIAFVFMLSSSARSDRIVERYGVVYREATDDYLFSATFSDPPDFATIVQRIHNGVPINVFYPDTQVGVSILNDNGGFAGHLTSLTVPDTGNFVLFNSTSHSIEWSAPPVILGNSFSITVPGRCIRNLDTELPLFPYTIAVSKENVADFQDGVPYPLYAQLNVPEPSSLGLLAGSVLCAGLITPLRRQLRRRQCS